MTILFLHRCMSQAGHESCILHASASVRVHVLPFVVASRYACLPTASMFDKGHPNKGQLPRSHFLRHFTKGIQGTVPRQKITITMSVIQSIRSVLVRLSLACMSKQTQELKNLSVHYNSLFTNVAMLADLTI